MININELIDIRNSLSSLSKDINSVSKGASYTTDRTCKLIDIYMYIFENIKCAFETLQDIDVGNLSIINEDYVAQLSDVIYENIDNYTDKYIDNLFEDEEFIAAYNSVLNEYPRFTDLYIYVHTHFDNKLSSSELRFLVEVDHFNESNKGRDNNDEEQK